ncbi:Tlg2-vesicle protein [Malassezia japonica]|uniref:Tlg2-vesicle protein n=1 Tax=Malassezia japonica TaxID=223818 RepID=A0AAF0F0R7_9BASI|nr:Tlg2-vesicle protein [Malassezia japonica]WFD38630.1 Tlg2-vesicle protein [Malassezia japonica]
MAGMAFASVDAKASQDGVSLAQSAVRLFYGWLIASGGLILSSLLSFVLLRRILARLHGQWDMLSTIKSDRRFRALQEASLDTLPLGVYILSSLLSAPRLIFHVFMGAKMYELMDRDVRSHQS